MTAATWETVIPYFTKARMRANCALGSRASSLLGVAPRFSRRDRRHRGGPQHARFARRLIGRRQGLRNRLLGDLRIRCEKRLGRLACSRDALAITAARMRPSPSVKHELVRMLHSCTRSKPDSRISASGTCESGGVFASSTASRPDPVSLRAAVVHSPRFCLRRFANRNVVPRPV